MEESKNSIVVYDSTAIQRKIYTIRGLQVMLDRYLAELYQVKAIRLREQVKRNAKRFPSDFMFQLTQDEVNFMLSQNAIPSKKHLGKKWFAFSKFDNQAIKLLQKLNEKK